MRIPRSASAILIGLLLIGGCQDKHEPTVSVIAKEETAPPPPMVTSPGMGMANRTLPPSALNQDSSNPDWTLPGGWQEVAGSQMRRASFAADGSGGPVDIAVTSFPGDVGGLLANLNRWRGQIGLPPLTAGQVEETIDRLTINSKQVIVTRIDGGEQSTMAAIIEHDGSSWFIKMTGPAGSVDEQAEAFTAYLNSIRFPNGQ